MSSAATEQLRLSAVEYGGLFSENFLENRLPDWPEYREIEPTQLMQELAELWNREGPGLEKANEAQLEEHFVQPVLDLLGHSWTPQAGFNLATGRSIPDYALFLSEEARVAAGKLEKNRIERFASAIAVGEAKEIDRPFHGRHTGARNEDPHAQILRYLKDTRVGWGFLTNGRWWRLYSLKRATQGEFYGVDLIALLQEGDADQFRRFAAFFRREAFELDPSGHSFLDRAYAEAEKNAVEVGDALERQVFRAVPQIASGLIGAGDPSPAELAEAYENALVLLYRLLFCLHAESRKLLPVDTPQYERESLMRIKREVTEQNDRGMPYSARSDRIYSSLRALFRMIDEGEIAFGVNAYNGGLFSPTEHPYFEGRTVPDPQMSLAIDLLSRVAKVFVDYRDLSVRHLGTIYEKLLAYELEVDKSGTLVLKPSSLKHRSGAYFTPQRVVDVIVARTLEPLLLSRSREIKEQGLKGEDALAVFLGMKICDPAAGSGHFLVAATQYIATFIATDPSYGEPAGGGGLSLREIERLVAERCIYGVDLNPMAVELARLSLWLATVDGEHPLTFLENLRIGNSIVGASVEELLAGKESVFSAALARAAEELLDARAKTAALPSSTPDDIHDKERLEAVADDLRRPLEEYADEALGLVLDDPELGHPFHWEVEFPEVFLEPDGSMNPAGGFDAVLGNPPYIQIQSLGRPMAQFCRERYLSAKGSFDAYIVFIERSADLLAPAGRLGFIAPNKVFKLESGAGLRGLLADRGLVEEIDDFGDFQVFRGVTTYTCILILDRSGVKRITYRRIGKAHAEQALGSEGIDSVDGTTYEVKDLDGSAWRLLGTSERALMRTVEKADLTLGEASEQIFTGLQTSADQIYVVEHRGRSNAGFLAYSKALGGETELETDLFHPIASGGDVDRYAFKHLGARLLFPYRRSDAGKMELIPVSEIEERWPLTAAYLSAHEEGLRGREKGKMDRDGWHGYVYPKSLANHDLPKLGVPRLCDHLRASVDQAGAVYLDNVDVNGILPREEGPSVWSLAVLLNSTLLDWVFKRGSVPFQSDFFSANKQFIAPLPVRVPAAGEAERIESLGKELHTGAAALAAEHKGLLDWLAGRLGLRLRELSGHTKLDRYEAIGTDGVLTVLAENKGKLKSVPVGSRAFREELNSELEESCERLHDLRRSQVHSEAEADSLVYELYELTAQQRATVEAEYA